MKRHRWGVALIALSLSCTLLFLAGCAKSAGSESAYDGGDAARNAYSAPAEGYESTQSAQLDEETASADNALSAGTVNIELHTPDQAKIIRTGYVDMETTSFDQTLEDISARANELGGYVESYNVSGSSYTASDSGGRYSTLTVRVPADQFTAFTGSLGEYGNITHNEMYTEDVTSQYTDIEARLASLRTQESRLLELLAQAENVTDMIEIETKLSDVRYEIESLTGTQKHFDERIAYSTITIGVSEVSTLSVVSGVPQSFGEELAQSFRNSMADFAQAARGFVVGIVYVLPYLVILVIAVLLIIFFTRRANRKRRAKMAENPVSYPGMPYPPPAVKQQDGRYSPAAVSAKQNGTPVGQNDANADASASAPSITPAPDAAHTAGTEKTDASAEETAKTNKDKPAQ